MEEAVSYMEANKGKTSLELIHFVVYEKPIYDEFQSNYKSLVLSKSGGSNSTVMSSPAPTPVVPSAHASPQPVKQQQKPYSEAVKTTRARASVVGTDSYDLPNGLQLQVLQGDISSDASDVIVNSTNSSLTLEGGGVAGALSRRGGPALQQICTKAVSGKQAQSGTVVITKTVNVGQLKCKAIFHIVFEGKDKKKLTKIFRNCLEQAEANRYTSIAFPAIGTGVHGFPPTEAASAMVAALKDFVQKHPKHVKIIRMVLFQEDVHQQFVTSFNQMSEGGAFSWLLKKAQQMLSSAFSFMSSSHSEDEPMESGIYTEASSQEISKLSLHSEVVLQIYGETQDCVDNAEKRMRDIIDDLFINKQIEDPNICLLPDETVSELTKYALENNVVLTIERDEHLHSIQIHGRKDDVYLISNPVNDAILKAGQMRAVEMTAKAFHEHIKWVRRLSDETTEEYDQVTSFEMERAYKQSIPSYTFEDDGIQVTVDFNKMEEIEADSGTTCKVVRVDITKGMHMRMH